MLFGAGRPWVSTRRLTVAQTRLTTNVSALSAPSDCGSRTRFGERIIEWVGGERTRTDWGGTGSECLLVTMLPQRPFGRTVLVNIELLRNILTEIVLYRTIYPVDGEEAP